MNQTSNQLLTNIFSVLTKIEKKVSSNNTSNVAGGMTKGGASVFGGNGNIGGQKTSIYETLKVVLMLPTIKNLTKDFSKNVDAKSYVSFVDSIVKINAKASKVTNKRATQELLDGVFSSEETIKSIQRFGKLEKSGILGMVVSGYETLVTGFKKASSTLTNNDIKKLSNMSKYIAEPLEYITSALTDFGVSMLLIGGTFLLVSNIFGFGNSIVGAFVGIGMTLLSFAGTMALIGKLGSGVQMGSEVINDVASSMIKFSASIVIMAGSFLLLNTITKSPVSSSGYILGGMLAVAGGLLLLSGTLALIGKMGTSVLKGQRAIQGMSASILSMTATLAVAGLLMFGSTFVNTGEHTSTPILISFSLLALSGAFWFIGMGSQNIKRGATGIAAMSLSVVAFGTALLGTSMLLDIMFQKSSGWGILGTLGVMGGIYGMSLIYASIAKKAPQLLATSASIIIMSMSIFAFGASLAGSALMFQKVFDTSKGWENVGIGAVGILAVVGGIAAMIGIYSGMATTTPLVAATAISVALMAGSVLFMGYSLVKTVEMTAKLPKDTRQILGNAIGGFVGGIWDGMSSGLGISGKNAVVGAVKGSTKLAAMTAGSVALMALSATMIKFAKAMSYFKSGGKIQMYTVDNDGKFQDGQLVDIVASSESAATAITSFLTKISTSVDKINNEKVQKVADVLLGTTSSSFMGIKKKTKPGLLDATMKFAEMLSKFAGDRGKFNIYDTTTKKNIQVPISSIATNIAESLVKFYRTIVDGIKPLETKETSDKVEDMAILLMGKTGMWSIGWKGISREPDKIGILEPIMKFAEIVKLLGSGKYKNENGEEVAMEMDGSIIAQKILNFTKTLTEGLKDANIDTEGSTSTSGFEKFTNFIDTLSNKTDVIDKVAESIDRLAESTAKLVGSLNELNDNKLNSLSIGKVGVNSSNVTSNSNTDTNSNNNNQQSRNYNNVDNSDAVANKIMNMFSQKTFVFEFTNNNGGKLLLR